MAFALRFLALLTTRVVLHLNIRSVEAIQI